MKTLCLALLAVVALCPMAHAAKNDGALAINQITEIGQDKIDITSSAFTDGKPIPQLYSSYGKSLSPPLAWTPGPQDTKSYVLILEDPSAPGPKPFVHWVAFNIPPGTSVLPEGAKSATLHFVEGKNGAGSPGYFGPRPPAGDHAHQYHFQIFALDTLLNLPAGADRDGVVAAMNGHVLAVGELVGLFQH